MSESVGSNGGPAEGGSNGIAQRYKRDFWIDEGTKFVTPHFRMQKAARIVNELARDTKCDLLDVGCGPATLMHLLSENIRYHGIDIAIQNTAPDLIEVDFLESPIAFRDQQFDIIVVQGVFEYLGASQDQKLAELRQVLNAGGTAVITYTNFGHRNRHIYTPYSNVRPIGDFRESLTRCFKIDRSFPASHNWQHGQPNRRFMKTIQMPINVNVPVISPLLGVEYFFICS
jgi:SAM-dependent methyltransferase